MTAQIVPQSSVLWNSDKMAFSLRIASIAREMIVGNLVSGEFLSKGPGSISEFEICFSKTVYGKTDEEIAAMLVELAEEARGECIGDYLHGIHSGDAHGVIHE